MSGSGWEALPDVCQCSADPPGCPGVVGGPPNVRKTSRISGSGPKALSNVREWSGNPHGYPGGPLRCLGVFRRPSWMSGWPSWITGVFVRLSRMSGSGRKTLPDIREGLPNTPRHLREPPGHLERVSRQLLDIREGLPPLLDVWQCLPTTPRHPGGPPTTPGRSAASSDHSRTFGRDSRPLTDIRESLSTTPGHSRGTLKHLDGSPNHSRTSERAPRTSGKAS